MARKSAHIQISEIPGDQYASLEAAQRGALDALALDMTETIRNLLASGRLVNVNGKIIPTPTGDT
jgi:hypothetical protein